MSLITSPPVGADYEDPKDYIVFIYSALAVVKFVTKNGYRLLDMRGENLILVNQKNLFYLIISILINLKIVLIVIKKRACKDIRIIGSKFTTNAKIFSLRPSIVLRIKKLFFQLTLVINYSLRGKSIPSKKIPEDCKKRILDAGLYI